MTAARHVLLLKPPPCVLTLLSVLAYAIHGPYGVRADMIVDRDVSRPDRFWSTLPSNCQDSYCSVKGAVAAGHCLCQCPKSAATLEIGAGVCVSTLSDCRDFVIGNSSEGVTTVDIVGSSADLQPALALSMNVSTNGSAVVQTSVASTLACPMYVEAYYFASNSSSWASIAELSVSSTPFAVRDDGRNMFLQWRSPEQSTRVAGKIVKLWLGCSKRDDAYAFRLPYCVTVKFKGQDSVSESTTLGTSTTPVPFVATKFFVIVICVLAVVVFIALVTCLACWLFSRRRMRDNPEMVVYSVTMPEGNGTLGGGHPVVLNGRAGGSGRHRMSNGVSMHPTAGNGYPLDRPDTGRPIAAVAGDGILARNQTYQTLDRSRTRESQDSGVGRSVEPSRSSDQSRVERSDGDAATAVVAAAILSQSSSSNGDQGSTGNNLGATDEFYSAEIERHLVDFEGTQFAHERRNNPPQLFKSLSERLTTVGASIAAADGDSSKTGGPTGLGPAAARFVSLSRQGGGERRRKEAVGARHAARRSRSARYSSRDADIATPGDDTASDSSAGAVRLEHFTSDRDAAVGATGSLRSPRKFTDGHVNKDVTFKADGTVIMPSHMPPPPNSGGRVDSDDGVDVLAAAAPSDGPLYSSVGRPRFASTGGRSGTAGPLGPSASTLNSRAGTPVTTIDDVEESDESDEEPTSRRAGAIQQSQPPPPPSRPPPTIRSSIYSSPDDERTEMSRSRGGGSGRHSWASATGTLRR